MWQEALDSSLDGEICVHIIDVEAQMMKFDFLLGVCLGSILLQNSNNSSKTLQQKMLSAADGQRIANLTLSELQNMPSDEQFTAFYQQVI